MIISEDRLLIKTDIENVFKSVKKFTKELELQEEQIELNQNILFDYYNLISNNISDIDATTFILHLLSREIKKSNIIEQKALLSLVPEFFVPFNEDIKLTYPYLNRILTTIQSNIQSKIPPDYIGEIFKKIIFYLFFTEDGKMQESINKKNFEICQGFCFYNMKLNNNNNQLVGIICLNILLKEIDYSFLNQNNFVYYIWENISYYLDEPNFYPKNHLLKYIYDLISKFKILFKPFVKIAIYKILEYIDDKNGNIRKSSLSILGLLISFYPGEIEHIKSLIIKLLIILNKDKDESIRIKSLYIYNKFKGQYDSNGEIKKKKKNKCNLFFYDFGYNIWSNQKKADLNKTRIEPPVIHRRFLSNNSSMFNLKLNKNHKTKTLRTETLHSKSDIGFKKNFEKDDSNLDISSTKTNNIKNNFKFIELLNLTKNQKDNKINQDFSDIRNIIKKNNNRLSQIKNINNNDNI